MEDAIQKFLRDYRMLDDGEIDRNLENMQDILNEAYDIFHDMGHREKED